MQVEYLNDPYSDQAARARSVYDHLLEDITAAKTIFVAGVTGPGGDYVLGESKFLCTLFPDLVFIDDYKAGTTIFGREVVRMAEAARRAGPDDYLINNCQSVAGFNHFQRQADSHGIRSCSTLEVLAVFHRTGLTMRFVGMNALYGPAFHAHALEQLDLYRELRDVFVDRLSQRTFDDLIRYRLTGDPTFLHRVGVGHHHGTYQNDAYILNKQFIALSDDEVFIDAGALTGDSSEALIRAVRGNFSRIVLFEPNPESAARCGERLRGLNAEFVGRNIAAKCEIIQKGLFSFNGELSFTTTQYDEEITQESGVMPQTAHIIETGFGDAFTDRGTEYGVIKVPVTTLDDVIGDGRASFIKFEIEGSEVDALNGATQTIRNNRPKMALSIYHRPQDLELMINYVRDLDMGYQMALRAHNPVVPDAIVLYCWTA